MDFLTIISLLEELDTQLSSVPFKEISNEDLKKVYDFVCTIRESSGLVWRPAFLEMCRRNLFSSDNGNSVA